MKKMISTTGDFVRAVDVAEIAGVAGSYRVQFSSRLRSARNPDEWQNNFALILSNSELESLRDVFSAALTGNA